MFYVATLAKLSLWTPTTNPMQWLSAWLNCRSSTRTRQQSRFAQCDQPRREIEFWKWHQEKIAAEVT